MIVFDKLWETLEIKGISQYKLSDEFGISRAQISRLRHNLNVTTNTLDSLCEILDCDLYDIVEYKRGNDKK